MHYNATAVSYNDCAVLIMGHSGAGKSRLALELIENYKAILIADDVVELALENGKLYASAPNKLQGCIEVRNIGIVSGLQVAPKTPVGFIVRLEDEIPSRLPKQIEQTELLGINVPIFSFCRDEKYLPALVKIAGKIVSNKVSLLQID